MPLNKIKDNVNVRIIGIEGGIGVRNKLASLGLLPGVNIRVLKNVSGGGPVLIEFDGSKIALGNGMAGRIMVSEGE